MSDPTIHGKPLVFSETNARQVVAESLQAIKDTKGYTDIDLGRILGKSEDTAALYRKGHSGMDAFSLMAAWREWNGEFIGSIRRFVEGSRPKATDDRIASHSVLSAAAALSASLANGDDIDPEDLRKNRAALEQGRDALDALLGRLKPEAA